MVAAPGRRALFRRVLDAGDAGPDAWERAVAQYARMQRALVPHADRMTALGVPDARTARLPGLFDALVAGNAALDPAARRGLVAGRPRLLDWCAELDAYGVPDSLDHCDLHDGQVLAPPPAASPSSIGATPPSATPSAACSSPPAPSSNGTDPSARADCATPIWSPGPTWALPPGAAPCRGARHPPRRPRPGGLVVPPLPGTPATDCAEASAHWLGELFAPTAPFEDAAV